jgi:hypothetical protein
VEGLPVPLQDFEGITNWVLPTPDEAERVGPIMEELIKAKLGIEEEEEEEYDDDDEVEEEEE